MKLQLREGGYYKTRDGRKVGPAVEKMYEFWDLGDEFPMCHEADGRYLTDGTLTDDDLIAEWTDGPAFTVGAKVRVTSESYGKEQLGKTGRVVEVGRRGSLDIEIEYDEPLIHANGLKRNQYRSEDLELIPDGPVRSVTHREVVLGTYEGVEVTSFATPDWVAISIPERRFRSASELKATAAVLLELAGALSDGE